MVCICLLPNKYIYIYVFDNLITVYSNVTLKKVCQSIDTYQPGPKFFDIFLDIDCKCKMHKYIYTSRHAQVHTIHHIWRKIYRF